MKKIVFILLFSVYCFSQVGLPHCGYDFTTYLVTNPIDVKTKKTIDSLTITLVDKNGTDLINTKNQFSFINADAILKFSKNYKVKLENNEEKWFYSICQNEYLLQLNADFLPEENNFSIKISDALNRYKPIIVPVFNNNIFMLCNTNVKSFGPKMRNNVIKVEMDRN